MTGNSTWMLWRQALSHRAVWRRSLIIGLIVGAVQILVNQGDHWWRMKIDGVIVFKTLTTPLIAISVALFSAAGSYVQVNRDRSLP
ncbi:MAG: hypothetical protein DWH91_19670 [Planctomycetota bacterium]|nr:MAG: hypothetical protein DWH91_19670 [Planctomycetota bacterium]